MACQPSARPHAAPRDSPGNARQFRDLVGRPAAIQRARAVTGNVDYMPRMVAADLAALANDMLLAHGSAARVRSAVVLETLKDSHSVPVR